VLTQELNFKHQAYINVTASGLTGVIALVLAFKGFGVWALAARFVLMALFTSFLYWIVNRWWPKGFITITSLKKLFGFGSKLMASGLLNTIYQHVYKLVIGRFFTAATLGFYTQASSFKSMASKNVVSSLQKVTYPILAKTKEDPEKLKSGYRKIIQITSFFIFPAMIGLALVAKPLIVTLIGEKWLPAVPMLQILCFSGMLYHLHAINLNILKVVGRSDLFLKLEIIKKVNITLAIIVGLQFGIWGLLIGQVISSYIALYINMYYTTTFISYTIKEQLRDILPIMLLMIPMVVLLTVLNLYSLPIAALQLITMIIGGMLAYGITNLLFRPQAMTMVVELLRPRIKFLQRFNL
jgi:O-antigen/teichoic acid export membrane protein